MRMMGIGTPSSHSKIAPMVAPLPKLIAATNNNSSRDVPPLCLKTQQRRCPIPRELKANRLKRPVRPGCHPPHRLLIAHPERAVAHLRFRSGAPPSHECRCGRGVAEVDRDRIVDHAP
jgi:hypothetical protein